MMSTQVRNGDTIKLLKGRLLWFLLSLGPISCWIPFLGDAPKHEFQKDCTEQVYPSCHRQQRQPKESCEGSLLFGFRKHGDFFRTVEHGRRLRNLERPSSYRANLIIS
jgi:hypothetical protein